MEGSPEPGARNHVVGRLGRPHGLEGFLGLYVESEDLVHFRVGAIVDAEELPLTVRELRHGKKGYQVAFEEIPDRTEAERIRGRIIAVTERRDLGRDEFWPEDLIGLEVKPGGGVVKGVEHGAWQDRLVIERDDVVFEVPFVDELVPVVDLEGGCVEIVEIGGLNQQSGR